MKTNRKFRIAKDENNLDVDCPTATGLTFSEDKIDEAFSKYRKLFPDCVIVEAKDETEEFQKMFEDLKKRNRIFREELK